MRIQVLLMALLIAHLHLSGQVDRVSMRLTDASLETFLHQVYRQTGCNYRYTGQNLANGKLITVHLADVTLPDALEIVFSTQPYKYTLENKTIIIADKPLANAKPVSELKGRVTDQEGNPVEGATVTLKQGGKATITDANGEYILSAADDDSLFVSHISYSWFAANVSARKTIDVQLFPKTTSLDQIVISPEIPTGYQKISEKKMTGSFTFIDSVQFNRRISTHFIDRIENMATGVLFSKNQGSGSIAGQEIIIRGISTIYGTKRPLIVIDNFPYDGDINNINPNDIETVTILKDAAATGLWGAFAGNGVIVLNMKKGKPGQSPKVSLVSNVMISAKPDLNYLPLIGSKEYMEVTKYLWERGFYNTAINTPYQVVPPDVMILDSVHKHLLTASEGEARLQDLRDNNFQDDLSRHFYRQNVNQQYALNINGGGNKMRYYFSAGYDKNLTNLERNYYERITLNANNVYLLLKDKLELTAGIGFTQSNTTDNNRGFVENNYPYSRLVDDNGTPAVFQADYRQGWKNSLANSNLLNWDLVPLNDLNQSDNTVRLTDYRVNLGVEYRLIKWLNITARYQYGKGTSDQENFYNQNMYFTRNLINSFSQIDGNGMVVRPIPLGGIMDLLSFNYTSHNARLQVDVNKTWQNIHNISATSGIERRSIKTQSKSSREYGYDPVTQRGLPVDYTTSYPLYATPFITSKISDNRYSLGTVDQYLSYYINLMYSLKFRYNFSVNLRKDESNLFGEQINQRGTPLWSVGAGWLVSREKFFNVKWLSELRLRATHGYTGNIDKTISPYTLVRFSNIPNNYNAINAYVANPANRHLQWEKVRITNFALDFSTFKNRISGTLEFYIKNSSDLIGIQPVDQTTGVSSYKGNTADMRGKGFDFTLNMQFIDKKNLKWHGILLYSYVSNEVMGYDDTGKAIFNYVTQLQSNPVNGTPLEGIYAYGWAGLDPTNGNPRGYLNKQITDDYTSILNSTDISNLVYIGSSTPKFFGSYRNTITYKNFDFSILLQYKLGYYFRRPSLEYYSLYIGLVPGHADYLTRWQKPGDELITNVPSMIYPPNSDRDIVYAYSEALVEKADHIRLQDIQLGYTISKKTVKRLPVQSVTFNLYFNNIGLIWKATDSTLDPEFLKTTFRTPFMGAFGLQVNF